MKDMSGYEIQIPTARLPLPFVIFLSKESIRDLVNGIAGNKSLSDIAQILNEILNKIPTLPSGMLLVAIKEDDIGLAKEATLSSIRDLINDIDGYAKNLDTNISSRASESTLLSISSKIDDLGIALSSRASETTLSVIKSQTDKLSFDENNNLKTVVQNWPIDYLTKLLNLDVQLSSLIDALKPSRSQTTQDLNDYILNPSSSVEIDKANLDGWSAIIASVKVTYSANATSGIRVRWLYSPNGSDFDSIEEADTQGNYYDLTFMAGATRQTTILIPILAPYVKISIFNKDTDYACTLKVWTFTLR
jgi:hypothetical protein